MKLLQIAFFIVNSIVVLGGVIPTTTDNNEEMDVASVVEKNINMDRIVDLRYNSKVSDENLNFWIEASRQHIVNSILLANKEYNDKEKVEEVKKEVLNEMIKEYDEADSKYNETN
ncbi:hypothetical protein PIROE2DRAFT_20422 [Piromyces sp. E2]|nr:hypothetical protein PIROE2DRAFT_20422 [Piromyces sp. E2]|eukprot:OUM64899.1 hypothetical protein PIROE2DRAFT_20422 [Piromyces sp. E2]